MKRLIPIFLILILIPVPVYADDKMNWVFGNVHDEMVECSAYYGLVQAIAQNSDGSELVKKLGPITKHLSQMIASTAKTAGITIEASLALYQLFLEKYRDTIDNNANNLPILILKYGDFCKQVVENGDSRLSFYWSEYDKKFGDKKASADLLKDKNSKLDGKSSIFFKCKTKKRGLMATDILELEPSTGKLF